MFHTDHKTTNHQTAVVTNRQTPTSLGYHTSQLLFTKLNYLCSDLQVARNVACLLFLCISHLQLAALSLIHISVDHTHSDYSGVVHLHYSTPSVHSAVSPTNSTSNTSAAELYSSHREAAAVQSSDEGMDSDVMSCTAQIILECFENSATLWAVFGIAGMTLHQ